MPYSPVSITGYNANPPEDDGTAVSTNEVSWAKHKTKIGDPLKTALEATQTAIGVAIDAVEAANAITLGAPTGTLMLFQQTAAPTGWTKQTTHNNKALRVVSGTASSGGSTAFTTVFAARTILQANLPSVNLTGSTNTTGAHTHTYQRRNNTSNFQGGGNSANTGESTTDTSTEGNHSHSVTVALGGSGTAMDFDVHYVDLIIAAKAA